MGVPGTNALNMGVRGQIHRVVRSMTNVSELLLAVLICANPLSDTVHPQSLLIMGLSLPLVSVQVNDFSQ